MASKKKDKKKDRKDKSSEKHFKDKLFVEKNYEEKPNIPFVYYDPTVNDVNVFQGSEQHFPDSYQTDVYVNETLKESRQSDLQTVTEIQDLLKKLLPLLEKLENQFR